MKKRFLSLAVLIALTFTLLSGTHTAATESISLTKAELNFIEKHPIITLGVDPEFVPYEFIDTDGKYKGIAADYIKLIEEKTNLRLQVQTGLTWPDAYDKAMKGEIDVLPCISKTAEREQYFLFSDPYYYFQRALYVLDSNNTIKSLSDCVGKTIAVQTNSSHHSFLNSYKEINVSLYETVEDALDAVSTGKELAFIGNEATSNYLIKEYGITNLKYSIIESEQKSGLYFAVRKDWPELVSILNKCIQSITKEEQLEIYNKWTGTDNAAAYRQILRITVAIISILVLVFIISSFWITRLKKEISLRKKAEAELKRLKEDAETANSYKSSFLARMSHEIRTPLNAITGMTYLLAKSDINSTQRIYLDKISQAAKNMLGIINDILDFSKIEAGKTELERIPFNLDLLLEQVVNIISYRIEEQGIDFSINKNPELPNHYFGDPLRLQQILTNIINNAIKFTNAGSVTVTVDLEDHKSDSCRIIFKITDTGIGMNKLQLDQIFTPFDQGDASISRRFGGTGLGLTIAKTFIELMGGDIQVESRENAGSAFTVRIPFDIDTSKESIETTSKSSVDFNRLHLLVIDRSPFYTNLIKDYLTAFHIHADFAHTSEQGLKLLMEAGKDNHPSYDLLLLDYSTPDENGINFYTHVMELVQEPPKCILMLPIAHEYLMEGLEGTKIAFGIMKPFMPSTLYNTILELTKIQVVNLSSDYVGNKNLPNLVAGESYHILIVEDNKTNQMIAQSILSPIGCRITLADDGKEGYEYYAEHREDIDLILMDLHMPVMNGLEATILIRKINREVPIIAMTADAITGIEEKCKSAGIDFYISKPFDPDQFLQTVAGVLHRQKRNPVIYYEETRKRIGCTPEVLDKILRQYYNETLGVAAAVVSAIEEEDFTKASEIIHKLKSSSGNIGAKELYQVASDLNSALKSDDRSLIQKILPEFLEQTKLVQSELKYHLGIESEG